MTKDELKKWRMKLGMTQPQLAELLGYARWAVIKWEQGTNPVPKWLDIIRAVKAIETLTGERNGKRTKGNATKPRGSRK